MATTEKPTIHTCNLEVCRNCSGDGTVYVLYEGRTLPKICRVCNGKGMVRVRKEIKIFIDTID